jgi:hypothetical protein
MKELGFGLPVSMLRKVAYQLGKSSGPEHLMNADKDSASKWWWVSYKKRYNLALRIPENLAAYRASMANQDVISEFCSKLGTLMDKLRIRDMPDRFLTCDETGLSDVVKPNKVFQR